MITYLRSNFTVNVTDEDIVAANRGVWWDDPIRRAVMRIHKLAYPIRVLVGWGYAEIEFEGETDKFDVLPDKAVSDWLRSYQNGWLVTPATFEFRLVKVIRKVDVSNVTTPKRYENRPPSVVKAGM